MNKVIIAVSVFLLAGAASCNKKNPAKPAVVARVYSTSYPPDENSMIWTSTVELKKTDGSYDEKTYITGTDRHAFENLTPGEYWINEESTRQSEKFILDVDETKEIDFNVP